MTLLRQLLRRAVRRETPSAWPPESAVGSRASGLRRTNPRYTYAQDTVLTVPGEADREADRQCLGDAGRRVTDVLYQADELDESARREFVVERLRELNRG